MEAQPAGWSRLFTDLTFLSGIGVGGGSSGRAVWDSMTYRSLGGGGVTGTAMKTSTSSRHICARFFPAQLSSALIHSSGV